MKPSGICKHHTFTGNIFDLLLLFTGDFTFHTLQQIKLDSRRETSKSELSRNLKRTAQEKGFVISDNQGEGNCMFFALSEQLDVVKGMRISHEEMRQTVVHYLMDHPTLVSRSTNLAFLTVFYNLHELDDIVSRCCDYFNCPSPLQHWYEIQWSKWSVYVLSQHRQHHFFCSGDVYAFWTTRTANIVLVHP